MDVYSGSAALYDILYQGKDYAGEVHTLRKRIAQYMARDAKTLLDVACGTGKHLMHLQDAFACTGLDLAPALLEIARERLPDVAFYQGDMCDFALNQTFDVVTCLFSAVGYVGTVERLNQAVAAMAAHVTAGGLLIIEPWLRREIYRAGSVYSETFEHPQQWVTRMSVSKQEGILSVLDVHYLVGTSDGVQHSSEEHRLAMFSHQDYVTAFTAADLQVIHDPVGLIGRGLYIGVKPE